MVPEKRAKCEGRSTLYGKLVGVSSLCGNLRFRRTDSRKSKPQIYELLRKQYGQGAGGKAESPKDIWKKEGCSRSFENAEYTLPDEDFFEDEKTEFPQTEEELFSGLSDEEKQEIMREAGLSEDEDGR